MPCRRPPPSTTTIPDNATPLYQRAVDQADEVGEAIAMPWDTQLDPASNTRLQQELTLLVQGEMTPRRVHRDHGRRPSPRTPHGSSSLGGDAGDRRPRHSRDRPGIERLR